MSMIFVSQQHHHTCLYIEAMNAKLNKLLEAEVGEDVGQMLPGGVDAGWVASDAVKDV